MVKFLRVLLISLIFSISNISVINSYSDEVPIAKEYYTEPIEILHLAKSLNINISQLYKIKKYPIQSPINPKDINRISSFYGERIHPIFKIKGFHKGIDYSANKGTIVKTTAPGIVKQAKYTTGYGKQILIEHEYGYSTRYAHLNDIYVKQGDSLKGGEIIGSVGSTGFSTGPHLHYEIRINNKTINPLDMYPQKVTEKNYMSYFNVINKTINYSDNV